MRLHIALALLVQSAAAVAAPPLYRCETAGKVGYSDVPCVGASIVDAVPTQGMDKMSGRSLKGHEVQRAERNRVVDDALRPLSGKTHAEMAVLRRRVMLPARDQAACRQLDARLPDMQEVAAQQVTAWAKTRADVDLYLARRRYFDLKC